MPRTSPIDSSQQFSAKSFLTTDLQQFQDRGSTPSTPSTVGDLYARDNAGNLDLYWLDPLGVEWLLNPTPSPPATLTFITYTDETADAPNSIAINGSGSFTGNISMQRAAAGTWTFQIASIGGDVLFGILGTGGLFAVNTSVPSLDYANATYDLNANLATGLFTWSKATEILTVDLATPLLSWTGPSTWDGNLLPASSLAHNLGDTTHRWLTIWGQQIMSGDFRFENDWYFTEAERLGLDEGIALCSPDGEVVHHFKKAA